MSSLVISGDTSGQVTLAAPAVAGTSTITLQAATATMSVNTLATAVASTSGTSITFTGIPSWVKRITVMFNGVSTSGTSVMQVQIGAGSVTTSGYATAAGSGANGGISTVTQPTTGFSIVADGNAAYIRHGTIVLTNVSGNIWTASGCGGESSGGRFWTTGGTLTLSGTLDRVVITTVNGTDTFDAGSINILYEG